MQPVKRGVVMPYPDSRSGPGIDCPARLLRMPKIPAGEIRAKDSKPRINNRRGRSNFASGEFVSGQVAGLVVNEPAPPPAKMRSASRSRHVGKSFPHQSFSKGLVLSPIGKSTSFCASLTSAISEPPPVMFSIFTMSERSAYCTIACDALWIAIILGEE